MACVGPYTGPSCSFPCVSGSDGSEHPEACGFEIYCHDDGKTYGISANNALLWEASPSADPKEATNAVEAWVTTHELDLGLEPGLTTADLELSARRDFRSKHGPLTILRFQQSYRQFPVLPPDDVVTVVHRPAGAISFQGTVADGRVDYDHVHQQAPARVAESSMLHHAHSITRLDAGELELERLRLVAIPTARAIGWAADLVHDNGAVVATMVVDANPQHPGPILPLWDYRGTSSDLAATQQVTVRTLNPSQDPDPTEVSFPMLSDEDTLSSGALLLGSIDDTTMEVQLGTEHAVVLDLSGGSIVDLSDANRVLDPSGNFSDDDGVGLSAQISHHLLHDWYAYLDGLMTEPGGIKRWDSANWSQGYASDAPPGTFSPRLVAFVDSSRADCDNGLAVGCAQIMGMSTGAALAAGFPELAHLPAGSTQEEIMGRISLFSDTINPIIIAHEAGHVFELFLGSGLTGSLAPVCGQACALECTEDTSDEAPPLSETMAQMFAQIFLKHTYDQVDLDYCPIVSLLSRSGTKPWSPGACIPEGETISLFQRPLSCANPDATYCDKPSAPGLRYECCFEGEDLTDCVHLGLCAEAGEMAPSGQIHTGTARALPTGACSTSPGYDTHSIMQAFWQLLNGVSCNPAAPFSCSALDWPAQAAPSDAVASAFLYALRLEPRTYAQMFDAMASFISCTYGAVAYESFNDVMCNHGIRDCMAPAPLACEDCGNGVREGSEECDGQDWALATCADAEGFTGGTLQCDPMSCQLDFTMCTMVGEDDTGGVGSGTEASSTGSSSSVGASEDGGEGCACSATRDREHHGALPWFVAMVLLMGMTRRRRDERRSVSPYARLSAAVGSWLLLGCGGGPAVEDFTSTPGQSDSSTTASSESSTGAPVDGSTWAGAYHQEGSFVAFGQPLSIDEYPGGLLTFEIFDDATAILTEEYCDPDRDEVTRYRWQVIDANALELLPMTGESLRFGQTELESLRVERAEPCADVRMVLDGGSMTLAWQPGAACWVNRCEDPPDQYEFDYCDGGAPTQCARDR